jgi:outer membrane protein TolC
LSLGLAQTAPLDLNAALRQALSRGPDLATSTATLENARADLSAKEADPSTLVVTMTQARNTFALNLAQVNAKRLEVMSNVTAAYLNLFEAQENVKLLEAQLALDTRNLEVARARLAAKNATQLDVSRAESTLASSRQSLADARAQLPILSNRLEPLLGVNASTNLTVATPPAFKEIKIDLNALENGLETRLPGVLQASQVVQLAELNVRLSDNDYTPPATLREARTTLENAKRSLDTTRANAITQLRDAARTVQNGLERVRIAAKDLDNAQDALAQDQARFKSGTISRVQLQTTEVSTLRSRNAYTQATNTYLRTLAQLSTAAGLDQTGMIATLGNAL